MKKVFFIPAVIALILANVIVYSCQKESVVTTVPVTTEQELGDRFAPCSPLWVSNGVGLIICGIDGGPVSCNQPCNPSVINTSDVVNANPDGFVFLNSSVISLMNPTGAPITCGIFAGTCAGRVATILPGFTHIFRVIFNPATGCCVVIPIECQ